MSLYCTFSEIYSDFSRKSQNFLTHVHLTSRMMEFSS